MVRCFEYSWFQMAPRSPPYSMQLQLGWVFTRMGVITLES